jgi:glycosyltransferase involved in cell wall biosynthesis
MAMNMNPESPPRLVFVHTICAHYRVRTFETLARHLPTKFYFFSAGREWYWQQKHGMHRGNFDCEYLPGFSIGQSRITPSLAWKLWRANFDVCIKCLNGKVALPLTYVITRLRRRPFVLWTGVWADLDTPVHRLIAPFTRYIYRHADAVVTLGEHVRRYLIGKGVRAERIFNAPHAVDNPFYAQPVSRGQLEKVRRELGVSPDARIVLFLGRIEASKGIDILLRAFAQARGPGDVLAVVGEGNDKPRLQELAGDLGLREHTRFLPYVPVSETPPFYAAAWVAVLPSITTRQTREPWGLTVNEAMNQGVPVIASDAVGAAAGGLVQDGITGLVFPEGDHEALVLGLRRILAEPGLRERLGHNARSLVALWDNERMVLGFRRAVNYVLGRGPGAGEFVDELVPFRGAVPAGACQPCAPAQTGCRE